MTDDTETRIANLEAKVRWLETQVRGLLEDMQKSGVRMTGQQAATLEKLLQRMRN
jgi:hypothetical protein